MTSVALPEECSVYTAQSLRALLVPALADAGPTVLDFGAVTKIDACGLQIVAALRKELLAQRKPFEVTNVNGDVFDLARQLGMESVLTRASGR